VNDQDDLSFLEFLQLQYIFHYVTHCDGKRVSSQSCPATSASDRLRMLSSPPALDSGVFSTTEVQQLYGAAGEAAGGTLQLRQKVDERGPYWLEIPPHTDGRACFAAAHEGEMHSHSAIIRPKTDGLVYICLKDPSVTCTLATGFQIDLKLAMSGELGLARLLHKYRGHDLVNVGTKSAEWCRFDPRQRSLAGARD